MKLIISVVFLLFNFILENNCSPVESKNETIQSGGSNNSSKLPCGLKWTIQGLEFYSENKTEIEKSVIEKCLCGLAPDGTESMGISGDNKFGIRYRLRIDIKSLKCTYDYKLSIVRKSQKNAGSPEPYLQVYSKMDGSEIKKYIAYKKGLTYNKSVILAKGEWTYDGEKNFFSAAAKNVTNMCETYSKGSLEDTFLKILKFTIAGGNDCPIVKEFGFETPKEYSTLDITSNVKLPCGSNELHIKIRSPDFPAEFVDWHFTWEIPNDHNCDKSPNEKQSQ